MNTIEVIRKPSIERAFREALSDPRSRGPVADALGWDDSQVSRFLSGIWAYRSTRLTLG